MKSNSKKLMALTTAALALPGMIPKTAQAQTIPDSYKLSYRFTEYKEEDQPASTTNTGEAVERYDISVHQFAFVAPISSQVSLNLDVSTETMSGASPWYVIEGADGKPVQVMSGATIEESRDDISFSANFYQEQARIGLGWSQSTENDYESNSANFNTSIWFDDKNTTLDFGFSFSDDIIEPTQSQDIDPNRVTKENKDSQSISMGLSQVVNKNLLVGAGLGFSVYDGYLSDPYKLTVVEGSAVRDSRPDSKEQLSLDFRLRQYIERFSASVHADYRFYDNDWGVNSHTLGLGWHQNVNTWLLSLGIRWYDQSAANFYSNFYSEARDDGYHSSDYRLSAYGALSYRLGVSKNFEFGTFKITYENYNSGEGMESEDELNPGLVDFQFFTVGFDYSF